MTATAKNKESKLKHTSTSFIAVLALVVSVIAAIPPFLSLNKDQAEIYYSITTSGITIPAAMDSEKVRKILSNNQIPTDTLRLEFINQGNAEAKETKISIRVYGKILSATFEPKASTNPIWVSLPSINVDANPNHLQFSTENLAIGQPVQMDIAYERDKAGQPEIQVFQNGKPANRVRTVYSVEPWSPLKVFKIPLIVLAVGIGLVVLWALGIVINNNENLQKAFVEMASKFAKEVINGIYPFGRF